MKKEQTLPKMINLWDWIEIQSTGWLALKQPKNLHLPHDTRFFQDSHKISKFEPATRDNLDWSGFGY
jgi:hypothetical protein